MEARATAKIKISKTPEIIETIKIYSKGLQFCVDTAWTKGISNNIKLQPFVYKALRSYGLQSQLAVACVKQACGMVKKAKSKPIINRCSMRYNFPRSASFKNNVLSISTIKGRIKLPFTIPNCYKEYFGWDVKESLLQIDKKGRCFFLFTFAKDIKPESSCFQNRVLGVDVGINHIAVTSNKEFFSGKQVKSYRLKYKRLRAKLQAKGTRSSRKLLKKLSGREQRFKAWTNHNISKEIVNNCKVGTIVLENLKGIRKMRKGRRLNFWLNGWSFYQLQNFITYKAIRKGIKVIKVNPFFTSQTCSKCGQVGSRIKGFFVCSHCGYSLNSDLNASFNLAKHHSTADGVSASVTMPNIQSNDSKDILRNVTADELMDKSS